MTHRIPQTPSDRSPPHSAEAEEHVIACCLIEGNDTIAHAVSDGVRTDTFYFPANKLLWQLMLEVYARNGNVTLETLAEELKTTRQLEAIGGFPYLMQVTGKVPTTAHAGYFIDKVLEMQALRDAIRHATGIVEKAYHYSGGGVGEELGPFIEKLTDVRNGVNKRDEVSLSQAAKDAIKQVQDMQDGKVSAEKTIPWGFDSFDRVFYPIMNGELVIIAARPSMGKTTLADQITLKNALLHKNHVAYFSLEVTVAQKPRKFAQILSGHSWRGLGKAHQQDRNEFMEELAKIRDCQYIHCYYKEQSVDGMCARMRVLHGQGKLQLTVIDYLQLMAANTDSSRNDAIGDITRKLKLLALELNTPIILLSQLNRSSERENREPRLSDLRDSGNIEQDADRVIFIHRPPIDGATGVAQATTDDVDQFYTDIIQAKGRDVGTAKIGLYFKRSRTTFMPVARETTH